MTTRKEEIAKSPTMTRMFQFPDREIIVDKTASKADLLAVIDYLAKDIEETRERSMRNARMIGLWRKLAW